MPTLVGFTGFEHGAARTTSVSASGGGVLSTVTSPVRNGVYALRCQASSPSGVASVFDPGSPNTSKVKVYAIPFYLNAALGDNTAARKARILLADAVFGACAFYLVQDITTGALSLQTQWDHGTSVSTHTYSGLLTGQWYVLHMIVDSSTTTMTVQWSITPDGGTNTAVGTSTGTMTSTGICTVDVGPVSGYVADWYGGTTASVDICFDDLLVSATSADYPISTPGVFGVGAAGVSGVGTHNLDASPSAFFSKTSAVALSSTDTTSNQEIDETPIDGTTDYVQEAASTTTTPISRVGGVAGAATSVTIPAHAIGDLMLMQAWRSGSATAPTVPAGWTLLVSSTQGGATKCFVGLYYKIATATNDTSGTWTSATGLVCEIYRNAATPVAADATANSGVSTTQNYAARTISDTTNSWLAAFGASASSGGNVAPAGLTLENGVASTLEGSDSNGVRSTNWSSTNVTITSQAWGTTIIEVKIGQTVTQPTATQYLEYALSDPAVAVTPDAVMVWASHALAAAGGPSAVTLKASDDGFTHETVLLSALSVSSTSLQTNGGCMAVKPSTGAWTLAAVQALKIRWGLTANVNPGVRLHSVYMEVAGTPAAANVVRNPAISFQDPGML